MNKYLLAAPLIVSGLLLAGCGNDAPPQQAPAAATTAPSMAAAPAPATTTAPAPAASAPTYQIPPFPISGIANCDHYASAVRRCVNTFGKTNEIRKNYESSVSAMLKEVTPAPGEQPNLWKTKRCTGALEALARKYPKCVVK